MGSAVPAGTALFLVAAGRPGRFNDLVRMTAVPVSPPSRTAAVAEGLCGVGLAVVVAGTTLALGGYLAETMVVVSTAVLGLAALALLACAFAPGHWPVRLHPAALLPVPFLLYALASVVGWAPAPWLAWREWFLWLQAWLVFVLVLHTGRSRGSTAGWLGVLVVLALVGVGLAAYQRFVDAEWMMLGLRQSPTFAERSAGSFGIPNSLAAQLELLLPGCLVLLFSRSVPVAGKVLAGWLAALLAVGLVWTGSRGGWLGLAGALMLWPVVTARGWSRVGRPVAVGLVLVLLFVGLFRFSAPVRERLVPFLDGRLETSRPHLWRAGVELWQGAPWLGTGAASYNVLFNRHRAPGFRDEPDWAHNDYLNTLSDYGVVGFALWAGAGFLALAWGARVVRRARREGGRRRRWTDHWRVKLGLWLGLVAFAVHLTVDFHTKIPALAFLAAVVAGLLLRDERGWDRPRTLPWRLGALAGAVVLVGVVWPRADRLYRAEALRYEPRREIDRRARSGEAGFLPAVEAALPAFRRATEVDPRNGQAWADYAYALALAWHGHRGDQALNGLLAEQAARRALELCPLIAEFWVRRGVAEDMQGRPASARRSFDQALQLAPNSAEYWYHLAFHLARQPGAEGRAAAALETCLALDPGNREALGLREQLLVGRLRNERGIP